MEKMLSVEPGFQYSVNIAYDLKRDEKLRNFMPTPSSLRLLEEILLSTKRESTDRARILIGAYGKGKSHIILMIMAMLLHRDLSLFSKLNEKLKDNERLNLIIKNYYDSGNKLLPVVITGSSTSISQAFLLALERTLVEQNLLDIMPETNFKAAAVVIERWRNEYPETFKAFEKIINKPVRIFLDELLNFDASTYEEFERIYPQLTSGGTFNPFLGFDIVELYESVVKSLKSKGYTGIYVVYDEFSKYLETNIKKATVSDTKMLQDFAEKCCRSGEEQLHLLLISHKDIANYIDKLPKQKVDGWRGISERFKHIYLNNNFSRTYEIIGNVIVKEKDQWMLFCENEKSFFYALIGQYKNHPMFAEDKEDFIKIVYDCYPLHPVTTYILPRLSELVAQNERTLFSFLSAKEENSLSKFLENTKEIKFNLVTPDLLFDYFDLQIRKEIYSEDIHKVYVLAKRILEKIDDSTLESKIVKTISLIYILSQFEKLTPTYEEIVTMYSLNYKIEEIQNAIEKLITQEYVVYLKRSNNFLCLKQSSGVDIKNEIANVVSQQKGVISVKQTLNDINYNRYMYPSRYNDEHEIIRYFSFKFIDENEITEDINWEEKNESEKADGLLYGVLIKNEDNIQELKTKLIRTSREERRTIFIVPKEFEEIDEITNEFAAVDKLKVKANGDKVLVDEYQVVYEDLQDVIHDFINTYTHPEKLKATYIYNGQEIPISRKAALSKLMSNICETNYPNTPVINNEAINKTKLTSMALTSRNKIVAGLLRNQLEKNLGLIGSGQDVSIMRSTLLRTGILLQDNEPVKINLKPTDDKLRNMLTVIINFIMNAKQNGQANFSDLYKHLTDYESGIGLRKGVIPIYLAVVFHEFKRELVITNSQGQVNLNADALRQINEEPDKFSLVYLNWSPEKERYIQTLADIFKKYINESEREINSYEYVVQAMNSWYLNLPKYAKEARKWLDGKKVDKNYLQFLKLLKQRESSHVFLFETLPCALSNNDVVDEKLTKKIKIIKNFYDDFLINAKRNLINRTKQLFSTSKNQNQLEKISISSVAKDWCETLDQEVFSQLFADGTEKFLRLFNGISHDEDAEIEKLARLTTELRIEDWDDSTISKFDKQLRLYKKTAEAFNSKTVVSVDGNMDAAQYQLTFLDEHGKAVIKRFEKTATSPRARLLYNNLLADIDAMGAAISEQEKRQILMEILQSLC